MADETADALRDMALHRGLKLVRSRRRKPGTGDYGKYGLMDEAGKTLYGFGEDGLTASAEDIEAFLRKGAASTWQQSAKLTPAAPKTRVLRGTPSEEPSAEQSVPPRSAKPRRASEAQSSQPAEAAGDRSTARQSGGAAKLGAEKATAVAAEPPPAPPAEPTLVIRAGKPADAAALAGLVGLLADAATDEAQIARQWAALRKAGGGVHVAMLGDIVGCVAWSVVPTLQRGPIGRITTLVVDERRRRRGIGSKLLAEAEAALARKGCLFVEAMSDIDLKNAHGFFRSRQFVQKSYRFVRPIGDP